MKTENKKRFHKIVSFMLAAVMMVSVFSVAVPQKAEAAAPSFKGSGKSNVKITDANSYYESGKETVIKFKSKVTGYITLTFSNASNIYDTYGFVTFCNSKKKALGKKDEFYDTLGKPYQKTRTYGVKKGSTYYFKVMSKGGVKINSTVVSVKKNAGTKRTNAKSLGKNKTIKGVIIAGSKAADWYKVKLTKKQILNFYYTAKTNGAVLGNDGKIYCINGIKYTVCKSNGQPLIAGEYDWANLILPSDKDQYYMRNTVTGQKSGLNPGTYYIKVEPLNKTSSGYYTIKWK